MLAAGSEAEEADPAALWPLCAFCVRRSFSVSRVVRTGRGKTEIKKFPNRTRITERKLVESYSGRLTGAQDPNGGEGRFVRLVCLVAIVGIYGLGKSLLLLLPPLTARKSSS